MQSKKRRYCQICNREIDVEEYDRYDGLCQECWNEEEPDEIRDGSLDFP